MRRRSNEEERALIGRERGEIDLFENDRGRRAKRALRRFFLLVAVALGVVAFMCSDLADELGVGIDDVRMIFGKEDDEDQPLPSEENATETESGEEDEGESVTDGEASEEGGSEKEEGEESVVTEIDLSQKEKGRFYFTNYSDKTPDVEGILSEGFFGACHSYSERPVVLIVHSHTSQTYSDAGDEVFLSGVVSVGEVISDCLNRCGIPTVHCTVIHDGEGEPYKNTASTIETMMKIYPSLKYVIDVQRMDITDERGLSAKTLVTDGASQIRLTVSAESESWRDSFSLALSVRDNLNEGSGRVCLPVVLTDSSYNSELSDYYLKIDLGALENTSAEAKRSGELFAEAFAETVKK